MLNQLEGVAMLSNHLGRNRVARALSFVAASLVLTLSAAGQSADWPQWGGPARDFKSEAKGLAAAWPESGPRRVWSRDLGEGYSAIAAEGGRLFTMYRRASQDVVVALDAATGKTVWEHDEPTGSWATPRGRARPPSGPR